MTPCLAYRKFREMGKIIDREGTPAEGKKLGLKDGEFEMILEHLGRTPSFTELAMFSGMWSEHCSYKNSILILKTLYSESDRMLAKPGEENAGAVKISDRHAVVFKIESHNHPSAVEPYQGAATGVGGIMRDIFTMGARPIATLNSLRFGLPAKDARTRYLLKRVVKGIGDYGNSLGIANAGGEIFFHESYTRNPLVNAMTVGVAEVDKMASAKIPGPNKLVVYVGAKTGRDGIHGASFASKNLSKESEEERSAVQVGDPFLEKLVMEATLECIQKNLVLAIQDMGAAGLVSSSSEMAASGGVGVRLDLEKVPARETEMLPFEFMLSESQERMLMVIDEAKWNEVKTVFDKWELDAAIIGHTTKGQNLQIYHNGECYADLPADILSKKAPRYVRETRAVTPPEGGAKLTHLADAFGGRNTQKVLAILQKLLEHPNLCSREPIYRQYDTDIGLRRIIGPGQNGCVTKVPDSEQALAMTIDGNGFYIAMDPYRGAQHTVAEAFRNITACGAEPLGLTNCLNFANPYIPENYWFFKEAVTGMSDACRDFKIPIISGNVSFYNESEDGPVLPTPSMGLVGLISNATDALAAAPALDAEIYLCGKFEPSQNVSQYQYIMGDQTGGALPLLDLHAEQIVAKHLLHLNSEKLLLSAIDLSAGGLLMALLRMTFAAESKNATKPALSIRGLLKMSQTLKVDLDTMLLGETAHSYLICAKKSDHEKIIKSNQADFTMQHLGSIILDPSKSEILLDSITLSYETLAASYRNGLKEYFV